MNFSTEKLIEHKTEQNPIERNILAKFDNNPSKM